MINCTGITIAIYRNGVFETLEPDGVAATIIEMKSDPYVVDGVSYVDMRLEGIRNLPEKSDVEILVNKEVALFGWSIGRNDLVYLDGTLVVDKSNRTVASQSIVRNKSNN